MSKIKFGKHKGQRWCDLPQSYLEWIVAAFKERSPHWYQALGELQRREDERSGMPPRQRLVMPLSPKKRKRKPKKKKTHASEHSGASWIAPKLCQLPRSERDAMFAELVDTTIRGDFGQVWYVEDWVAKFGIPKRMENGLNNQSSYGGNWDWSWEPSEYVQLELALDKAILRD